MKKDQMKNLAYLALYVALYVVLKFAGNLIPFLNMPNGGSIELELVAVFIASYHLGWKSGMAVALLSWLITIVLGFSMWFVHPVQIFLDYAGPLLACGLASLLWPFKKTGTIGSLFMALVISAAALLGIVESYGKTIVVWIVAVVIAIALFAFNFWYIKEKKRFGIVIAMFLKYFLQVLSGVYFWFPEDSYAGSSAAWTFSLGYNLWYNLVTLAVCAFIVPLLIERLEKVNIKFVA